MGNIAIIGNKKRYDEFVNSLGIKKIHNLIHIDNIEKVLGRTFVGYKNLHNDGLYDDIEEYVKHIIITTSPFSSDK